MKQELLEQLASAANPRALAESIYSHCAPAAAIRRIDLICNERDSRRAIACFVATPSLHAARALALHLGATVFGEQGVVFEVPRRADFACSELHHAGDAALPVRVRFDCLRP